MDYKKINRDAWNKKTVIHLGSPFYDNEAFLDGKNTLKDIDLDLLGNINGKTVLHLQCHFGQDTISLSKSGARAMGVDISDTAIEKACEYAKLLGTDTEFICSDLYELPRFLDRKFDVIYTSYGVIGWLPDMERWAQVISHFLKPGGEFVFVEFHPFVWMYNTDMKNIVYRYFNGEPFVEQIKGTYAQRDADMEYTTVNWNHALSEVMGSLLRSGICIEDFREYDYSPYDCFPNTVKIGEDKYRFAHLGDKVPIIYALKGRKSKNTRK